MKKAYYSFVEDGSDWVELHRWGSGTESFLVTISSSATPDNAFETLTAETAGQCLGPGDDDFLFSLLCELVRKEFSHFEEMSEEETSERIEHLAEEWGLEPREIDYLI